jgi:Zn-dependent protease with chaperone function
MSGHRPSQARKSWIIRKKLGTLVGMETIKYFPEISSRSWEHPADRAALSAFKAIPGADVLVKKFVGLTTEKSLKLLMLASSARVTESQFPGVNKLTVKACEIFDVKDKPDVYVSQNPVFNAGAYGVDKPFIVLNSSLLDMLDEKELLSIIGHELGHVASGHALYKTLLWFIMNISSVALSSFPLANLALYAILVALNEWDRKSELSADRAGLLAVQDGSSSYTALMKSAGGRQIGEMDVNEFFKQAGEYDAAGDALDSIYKLLNTLGQSHPFPVVRIAELKTWEKTGYADIMNGSYARRGDDERGKFSDDFMDATKQYKDDFRASKDPFAGMAGNFAAGAEELARSADKVRQQVDDFFTGLFNKRP